jgi:hypothetical protein
VEGIMGGGKSESTYRTHGNYPGCEHPFIRVDDLPTEWNESLRDLTSCCRVDACMLVGLSRLGLGDSTRLRLMQPARFLWTKT